MNYGPLANVQVVTNAGAPVNAVTGAGELDPGSLLIDVTNFNIYINAGTKASPTWALVSLSALSAAELTFLDGVTAGVAAASKAVVLNAAAHIDALKTTALSLGALGSATLVTATAAQLNSMAGALTGSTALVASGLGGSHSVLKSEAGTHTVLAVHATKARACLVIVTVDETYAIGTGTLPTVEIGEDDTIDKCMAHDVSIAQAAGTTLVYAFTNTANKKVIITTTAAIGNSTGGCTVTVLAIPTT